MANIKVEIAVVVEIGEGRRGRPVAITGKTGLLGDVFERAVAAVAIKRIRPKACDEQVGMAVVVIISHGDAVSIPARHGGDARCFGHVLERAVTSIAEEMIARLRPAAIGRKRPALHAIHIKKSVTVEIEKPDTAAKRLGKLTERRQPVIEHKFGEARGRSAIFEARHASGCL